MGTTLAYVDKGGNFLRKPANFRDFISKDHEKFQPESGRYHLYISWACPWANRVACVRQIKGLQDAIGMTVVHPTWISTKPGTGDTHTGWSF